jgi:mycofactocin precursor
LVVKRIEGDVPMIETNAATSGGHGTVGGGDPAPQGTVAEPIASPTRPIAETECLPTALVEDELLVEEVSIDGMCGVY